MSIEEAREFFKWCLIWSGGLYLFSTLAVIAIPDFIYKMQSKFIKLERKQYDFAIYTYLGNYKILLIMFVLVPYLALRSLN